MNCSTSTTDLRVHIQQQDRDRISPFEHQAPLAGAHRAVDLLVCDQKLVNLEEIVEYATLPLNDGPARHCGLRSFDLLRATALWMVAKFEAAALE